MPAEAPPMVDWALARSTATRLVRSGPAISADGASAAVAELREAAARAERYVTEVTGLDASSGSAPVLVVDRPGWIKANLDAFRLLLTPLTDLAASKVTSSARAVTVGSRVTGAEVGVLLSYLAPKVLGQFDPFWTGPDGAQGRLLLVAPNVVEVERLLRVPPSDFRLWVCLHEETHRVQFTAVPWLREHLLGLISRLVATADFDNGVLAQVVKEAVRRIVEGIREGEELSVVDLVQTPAQRAIVDEITAVMSLLEGHADVVMDSVGPDVVPSVALIRAKVRRPSPGPGTGQDRPAAAGPGRQDAPVPRRRRLLPPRPRRGRHDRAEPGLDLARHAAQPRRDREPPALGDPQPPRAGAAHGRLTSPDVVSRRALGPATLAVVQAVRRSLAPADRSLLVACSGGADSLALAAGVVHVAREAGLPAAAVVVDHGLQEGSADVADAARAALVGLGHGTSSWCASGSWRTAPGREAAARDARHAALRSESEARGATLLLGHTRDDQAETVLLGLARGSGARSLAGMAVRADGRLRPLLGLPRTTTLACCAELGLQPWTDHTTTPTPPTPGSGSVTGCCRCSRPSWDPGSPPRSPAPRTCCAPTPTCSTASPTRPGPAPSATAGWTARA